MQTENELAPLVSPEEEELAAKRRELALLLSDLADRELFLANLRMELASFEGRYLREVGVLYAELDNWNAKLAELAAEVAGTEQARAAAAAARAQADESYAASHGDAAKVPDFHPSPELKKLYREVVNQIHPDRAWNGSDHALRERLMKEATAAYRRGDADALKRILVEYKSSPESVRGDGAAAELQRILRQIERIARRLAEIEEEAAALASSEIALLMAKVETATARGRNLLAEMKQDVLHRIALARSEYEDRASEGWSQ